MKNPFKYGKRDERITDPRSKPKKDPFIKEKEYVADISDFVDLEDITHVLQSINRTQELIDKTISNYIFTFRKPEYREAREECMRLFGRDYITSSELQKITSYVRQSGGATFPAVTDPGRGINPLTGGSYSHNVKSKLDGLMFKVLMFAFATFVWSVLDQIFQKLLRPILSFKFLGATPLKPLVATLGKIIASLKPILGRDAFKEMAKNWDKNITTVKETQIEDLTILDIASKIHRTVFEWSYIKGKNVLENNKWVNPKKAALTLILNSLHTTNQAVDGILASQLTEFCSRAGVELPPYATIKDQITKGEYAALKEQSKTVKEISKRDRIFYNNLGKPLADAMDKVETLVKSWAKSPEFSCCIFFTLLAAVKGINPNKNLRTMFSGMKEFQETLKMIRMYLKLRHVDTNISLFLPKGGDVFKIIYNALITAVSTSVSAVMSYFIRSVKSGNVNGLKDNILGKILEGNVSGFISEMSSYAGDLNCLPGEQLAIILLETATKEMKGLLNLIKIGEDGTHKYISGMEKDFALTKMPSKTIFSLDLAKDAVKPGKEGQRTIEFPGLEANLDNVNWLGASLDFLGLIDALIEFFDNGLSPFIQCEKYLVNYPFPKVDDDGAGSKGFRGSDDPRPFKAKADPGDPFMLYKDRDGMTYQATYNLSKIEEFARKNGYTLPADYKERFKTCLSKFLGEL